MADKGDVHLLRFCCVFSFSDKNGSLSWHCLDGDLEERLPKDAIMALPEAGLVPCAGAGGEEQFEAGEWRRSSRPTLYDCCR